MTGIQSVTCAHSDSRGGRIEMHTLFHMLMYDIDVIFVCVPVCVSGYWWTDIASCVDWMSAFATVLCDNCPTLIKFSSCVLPEAHVI